MFVQSKSVRILHIYVFNMLTTVLSCQMGSASNWNLSSFRKTPRKSIMEIFDKRAASDNQKSPIGVTKNLLDVEPSATVSHNI